MPRPSRDALREELESAWPDVQEARRALDGLMTDREARKRNVGGEVLCYVW